ncbi:MAG TPA: hypothetical protein EYP67_05730 [Methanosarcinales archaeon]|nr:hypothetical protein [Methanosarcinales archaeon]
MNKQIVLDILTNILKSQGYAVKPYNTGWDSPMNLLDADRGDSMVDLVVEKDGKITHIRCGENEDDLRRFAGAVRGSHDALFISDEITDWTGVFADQNGVRTWDRDELETRIGKAILAEAEGTHYDFLGATGYGYGSYGRNGGIPMPESRETVAGTSDAAGSRDLLQLRCAPIMVEEKRAISTAKGFVSDIRNIFIEFVPFWNYKYAVNGYQQHKTKMVHISAHDSGAINALNKQKYGCIMEIQDQLSVPCDNYVIKSLVMAKEEAEKQILDDVITSNTKTMSFTSKSGDAIITEHRTVKPRPGDVNLDIELVYLPFWVVDGARSSIRINACDGSAMTEPIDDDIEFL